MPTSANELSDCESTYPIATSGSVTPFFAASAAARSRRSKFLSLQYAMRSCISRHSAAVSSESRTSAKFCPSARDHLPHMKPLARHSQPSKATCPFVASRHAPRRSSLMKVVFGQTERHGSARDSWGESTTGGERPARWA